MRKKLIFVDCYNIIDQNLLTEDTMSYKLIVALLMAFFVVISCYADEEWEEDEEEPALHESILSEEEKVLKLTQELESIKTEYQETKQRLKLIVKEDRKKKKMFSKAKKIVTNYKNCKSDFKRKKFQYRRSYKPFKKDCEEKSGLTKIWDKIFASGSACDHYRKEVKTLKKEVKRQYKKCQSMKKKYKTAKGFIDKNDPEENRFNILELKNRLSELKQKYAQKKNELKTIEMALQKQQGKEKDKAEKEKTKFPDYIVEFQETMCRKSLPCFNLNPEDEKNMNECLDTQSQTLVYLSRQGASFPEKSVRQCIQCLKKKGDSCYYLTRNKLNILCPPCRNMILLVHFQNVWVA